MCILLQKRNHLCFVIGWIAMCVMWKICMTIMVSFMVLNISWITFEASQIGYINVKYWNIFSILFSNKTFVCTKVKYIYIVNKKCSLFSNKYQNIHEQKSKIFLQCSVGKKMKNRAIKIFSQRCLILLHQIYENKVKTCKLETYQHSVIRCRIIYCVIISISVNGSKILLCTVNFIWKRLNILNICCMNAVM